MLVLSYLVICQFHIYFEVSNTLAITMFTKLERRITTKILNSKTLLVCLNKSKSNTYIEIYIYVMVSLFCNRKLCKKWMDWWLGKNDIALKNLFFFNYWRIEAVNENFTDCSILLLSTVSFRFYSIIYSIRNPLHYIYYAVSITSTLFDAIFTVFVIVL